MLPKNLPLQRNKAKRFNRAKGSVGESIACAYLLNKGYILLERNFSTRAGEIDIIAKKPNGTIAFIEVKARIHTLHGFPYESVTWAKRKKLAKTIQYYLLKKKLSESKLAFEVVSILLKNSSIAESIQHFEDVPLD